MNIDSPLNIAPFTALLQSLGDRLHGPEFPALWQQIFYASFHVELLPPAAQDLVRSTCRPRQDVALGYWQQLIDQPAASMTAMIAHGAADLRASGVPTSTSPALTSTPENRQWLDAHLPAATVEVWPRTGHFPHLAHPQRFARRLAGTAHPSRPMDLSER